MEFSWDSMWVLDQLQNPERIWLFLFINGRKGKTTRSRIRVVGKNIIIKKKKEKKRENKI
jgi:hypothetical protein